jgi:hypothetical protein
MTTTSRSLPSGRFRNILFFKTASVWGSRSIQFVTKKGQGTMNRRIEYEDEKSMTDERSEPQLVIFRYYDDQPGCRCDSVRRADHAEDRQHSPGKVSMGRGEILNDLFDPHRTAWSTLRNRTDVGQSLDGVFWLMKVITRKGFRF